MNDSLSNSGLILSRHMIIIVTFLTLVISFFACSSLGDQQFISLIFLLLTIFCLLIAFYSKYDKDANTNSDRKFFGAFIYVFAFIVFITILCSIFIDKSNVFLNTYYYDISCGFIFLTIFSLFIYHVSSSTQSNSTTSIIMSLAVYASTAIFIYVNILQRNAPNIFHYVLEVREYIYIVVGSSLVIASFLYCISTETPIIDPPIPKWERVIKNNEMPLWGIGDGLEKAIVVAGNAIIWALNFLIKIVLWIYFYIYTFIKGLAINLKYFITEHSLFVAKSSTVLMLSTLTILAAEQFINAEDYYFSSRGSVYNSIDSFLILVLWIVLYSFIWRMPSAFKDFTAEGILKIITFCVSDYIQITLAIGFCCILSSYILIGLSFVVEWLFHVNIAECINISEFIIWGSITYSILFIGYLVYRLIRKK